MANLNRDYLVTLDVKTSNVTLSSPMTFYVTDRRTMNIFVKLVMNMSDNPIIKDYAALENAVGYRTELVLVAPNNQPFYLEGELLNGDEALFCFNLDTEQISKIGDWVCELRVYSIVDEDEEIVTSKSFLYSVNESITTSLDDVVMDTSTYGIIDELIGRIEDLESGSAGGENDLRLNFLEATKYDDVQVQKTQGKITLTFFANKTKMKTVEIPASEGLEQRVADCEESIAWLLENGGGGGGVVSAYLSTTDSENFVLPNGTDLELHLDFYSPNIGKGTLKVSVDDTDIMSTTLSQGETTVVIEGGMLHKGANIVKVYAVDRAGVMTNVLQFNVRYGSTELTTTFDQYQIYDVGAVVRYYFTAIALNTADKLTFHMLIDNQAQTPVECTSDVRAYFTFPILSIGTHYCEAWVEDSYGKSNILAFNFVVLDETSLAINSTTRSASVEEGAQLTLDYRVYRKNTNKFITETYIDNNLVNTGECNADTNFYSTSSLAEGRHIIKIVAYDLDRTVSDFVTWSVNITPSTYQMKAPIKTGSIALFTAKDRTNSDQDRDKWTGVDQDNNTIVADLNGFSYDSDNGWNNNELIISGKSNVEIPIAPLANNARYGFTLDIEFTSKQIGVEDAEVLTLWNEADNCGIKITTEKLILRSKAGNECNLYFSDNENVSAMFIIDRDEKTAKIYLNGVMCEAFSLSDYVVGGQTYLEDFTVPGNIILGGGANKNGYCKIKNLRIYEVALATNEILNNWLSNITDKTAQREMEKFQDGADLPTLTVYCDFAGLGKDDKKPCDIIYYSPDVTKYGESFTLSGKTSQLQYQGTSSMQYPIKNYRLNLRDAKGDKWYYNPYGEQGGQPECRFTLKADFMSSGHWQNTGLAKFVSDKLYGYKTNDLSTMNPAKRYDIQNGGTLKDTRDSINGFPCRLILVNDGTTPLNEGQQEPTPGNTKDMGIFNFNNDKDNVTSLGLDTEIFPNALSYEVTANSDTSAGAFVPYEGEWFIDYFLNDNGYYLTSIIDGNFFGSGTVTITFDECERFAIQKYTGDTMNQSNYKENGSTVNVSELGERFALIPALTTGWYRGAEWNTVTINDITYTRKELVASSTTQKNPYLIKAKELEYLQNSFELRYPDEDDVGKDYGYLGMMGAGIGEFSTTYTSGYLSRSTHHIDKGNPFGSIVTTDGDITSDFIEWHEGYPITLNVPTTMYGAGVVAYNSNKEAVATMKDNCTWTTTLQGSNTDIHATTINITNVPTDTKYIRFCCNTKMQNSNQISIYGYNNYVFSTDYGLKRVIDWVGNCTDEEFVADYEKYFDKHYLLRYYLLVITLGMVDNLGKNMMLDTWDGQIWYPRFYDMDTICSYDNSGAIKFDVDIEMQQGYWNTSSSRLWTKVRDLLHDELVVTYKDMRASGLSYDGLMNYFYGEQIAKIPQKYYNMDADVKYLPYADEYLGKAHGNGYEHLKRWLKNRLIFTDTLFDYAPSYESDMLTIRANTLDPITFEIETYTPVYQHVSYYNGQMSKLKIDGKTATAFTGNAQTATDQEILIYGGSNIKRIRGISSANPDSMLIGKATKLAELDISNCPILTEVNSNKANFAPHSYLNKLNIENCPNLGGTLELSNSPLIQEIKARGTAVNGLRLPTSVKNLETLELPNTISTLALYDASSLENLKFDEGVAMQSIELSNCTGITNTENFDLTKTPTVILDNSYNTDELYMSETTNLTLRNMSNLERVIYTPNSEYSEFDINNVIGGKNYKVTTNGCPKLTTFMTTAPHRDSYGLEKYKEVTENKEIIYTMDMATQDGSVNYLTGEELNSTGYKRTDFIEVKAGARLLINTTTNDDVALIIFDTSKKYVDYINISKTEIVLTENGYIRFRGKGNATSSVITCIYDIYIELLKDITPNTSFTANTLDLSATQFTDIKLLCTTDVYNLKVPTTLKNFYCDSAMDIDTDVIEDASYEVIHEELIEPYTTHYEEQVLLNGETPNIIPSSANGSLIFNMYSNNTTQPTSASPYMWDLTGLKLEDFYTYGMNNNVKEDWGDYNPTPLPFASYVKPQGSVGEKINFIAAFDPNNQSLDNSIHCLRVKPGETYVLNKNIDGYYYYAEYWGTTLDGTITFVKTGVYNNTVVTVPSNTELFWIAFNYHVNKEYINKEWNYIIGNGKYWWANPSTDYTLHWDDIQNMTYEQVRDTLAIDPATVGNAFGDGTIPPRNITMPQRMPGYSVRLVNADITPNEYPTMLYPKWIDTGLPITGKLDYTAYNGTSLAWAYAYTTGDVNISPLGSQHQGNITQDYNKLYGTDFVDIVDVWVYKDTDTSKLSTNEAITKAYIELTSDNYKARVNEALTYYPNCTDVYLFEDGSVTSLKDMFNTNNTIYRNQIVNVTFMDGYFDLLTDLSNGFREMKALKRVNNIPNSVKNMKACFLSAYELEYVSNFPSNLEFADYIFANCNVMTSCPSFPNNGKIKNLSNAFRGCNALTTAPTIPNSVTNMSSTFYECTSLTQAPAIPQGVTDMSHTFYGCTSLITPPAIPQGVTNMLSTFYGCTSLTTPPAIPSSVTNMGSTFQGCTALINGAILHEGVVNTGHLYTACSSLETVQYPLTNSDGGGGYPVFQGATGKIKEFTWTGERKANLNILKMFDNGEKVDTNVKAEWIQDLVSEHLADLTALGTTATLTLGETYLSYLTEDEIAQAVAKGWTLQ